MIPLVLKRFWDGFSGRKYMILMKCLSNTLRESSEKVPLSGCYGARRIFSELFVERVLCGRWPGGQFAFWKVVKYDGNLHQDESVVEMKQ